MTAESTGTPPPETRTEKAGLSRRLVLGGALGVAAIGVWKVVRERPVDVIPLLNGVCDLTIPATDTPGAVAVGVPAFVQTAIATGLAGAKPDLLKRLTDELNRAADGTFASMDRGRQETALRAHDAACFGASPPETAAWPTVKKLILMGYYTSEVGASKELRYELDRGGFTADMPFNPGDRAFFNNWFGMLL